MSSKLRRYANFFFSLQLFKSLVFIYEPIHLIFCFYNLQFVVGLGDKVSPTDIEEGMRVGYVELLMF